MKKTSIIIISMFVLVVVLAGCSKSSKSNPSGLDENSAADNSNNNTSQAVSLAENYVIVDTNQTKCFSNLAEITCPTKGEDFYGQDAQYEGAQPSYKDNGDGTITDNNTGLIWVKARGSKMTWDEAVAGASSDTTGGYEDWRMPSIQELYSLFLFSGENGNNVYSTNGYVPFIDTNYFDFEYGSGVGDERVMDCQDWSGTEYVSNTQHNQSTVFGVNFCDGRSKGYKKYLPPKWTEKNDNLYVRYVRGNPEYGKNDFKNNNNGTISDLATGLMWSEEDSKKGLNWKGALAWVQEKNAENYLGHNDWRLPDIKELHSIVDYTRSPEKTSSAAININYFKVSAITNEANQTDYPYFWSGTVLVDGPTREGAYIPFGRAMAYMDGVWQDVHGAGSQKSDIMIGDPANYPEGHGPQGDAVRVYNYVRLVRGGSALAETVNVALPDSTLAPTSNQNTSTNPPANNPSSSLENRDQSIGRQIPQEAIVACENKSEGTSCSVVTSQGNVSGTCNKMPGGTIACVPKK